ncbi:uncharacterized protein LOC107045704 [Diachasma alloeum]|uniref:uncharacterized protein LOC107045704 n=1 Tax=Diachasma alloeum TaxID=454923 RepID=UPI0007383B20|nr:uncharacterized protein LOC107045704 [Diachasma alloeum]
MPKLYANVKWIGGDDHDKVTVGIPTEWILNFNYEEFLSENFDPDESFVIEWRESGKKPPGGWPVFDGLVLDDAATVAALERRSTNYEYPKSPRVVTPKTIKTTDQAQASSFQASGSQQKRALETPINQVRTKKNLLMQFSSDEDTEEEEEIAAQRTPLSALNHSKKTKGPKGGSKVANDGESHNNEVPLHPEEEEEEDIIRNQDQQLDGQNERRQHGPDLLNQNEQRGLENIAAELKNLLQENIRLQRQGVQNEEPNLVELGQRGSGVTVTALQWSAAKEQKTFACMAVSLVMSVFDHETLLNSNVKGGKSKIHKNTDNAPRHQRLDPHKLEAIPGSFSTLL